MSPGISFALPSHQLVPSGCVSVWVRKPLLLGFKSWEGRQLIGSASRPSSQFSRHFCRHTHPTDPGTCAHIAFTNRFHLVVYYKPMLSRRTPAGSHMPGAAAAVAGTTPTAIPSVVSGPSSTSRRAAAATTSLGASSTLSPLHALFGQPPSLTDLFALASLPPPHPYGSMVAPTATGLLQALPETMNLVNLTSFEAAESSEIASRLFSSAAATSPALAASQTASVIATEQLASSTTQQVHAVKRCADIDVYLLMWFVLV